MVQAYIALGSNIEPRERYLHESIGMLRECDKIEIIQLSSIYETEPVGYIEQSTFLNMVVKVKTFLGALELLDYCQFVESELGRKRLIQNGPRTIDLDILLYNQETIKTKRLTVPHPRMHERAFVLVPLHEIAPEAPLAGKTVNFYYNELPENDIKDVTPWKQRDSAEE